MTTREQHTEYIMTINRSSNDVIPLSYEKWLEQRIAELEAFVTSVSILDLGHDVIADANILIDLQGESKSLLGIDNPSDAKNTPF